MPGIRGILNVSFVITCLALCSGCVPRPKEPVKVLVDVTKGRRPLVELQSDTSQLIRVNSINLAAIEVFRGASGAEHSREIITAALERSATFSDLKIVPASTRVGADATLHTLIKRFEERRGTAVAADSAAEVDFEMKLTRSGDGLILWQATYHLGERALSEDLLVLANPLSQKHSKGWRTANEVIESGFVEAFKALGSRRREAFGAN